MRIANPRLVREMNVKFVTKRLHVSSFSGVAFQRKRNGRDGGFAQQMDERDEGLAVQVVRLG
jgi:hypothetical protein